MLGGIPEGSRELLSAEDGPYGVFEQTVELLFGEELRADKGLADQFWGALANIDWFGPAEEEIGYSFRAAGDLLAAIRRDTGRMTYMNYYCSAPYGRVPEWISERMGAEGWTWKAA